MILKNSTYPFTFLYKSTASYNHTLKQTNYVVQNSKANELKCVKQLSKLSLLCSFSVFQAYTQTTWRDPPFLKAWSVDRSTLCCWLHLLLCQLKSIFGTVNQLCIYQYKRNTYISLTNNDINYLIIPKFLILYLINSRSWNCNSFLSRDCSKHFSN